MLPTNEMGLSRGRPEILKNDEFASKLHSVARSLSGEVKIYDLTTYASKYEVKAPFEWVELMGACTPIEKTAVTRTLLRAARAEFKTIEQLRQTTVDGILEANKQHARDPIPPRLDLTQAVFLKQVFQRVESSDNL